MATLLGRCGFEGRNAIFADIYVTALNQTPAQPMAVNGATTTDFLPCENLSTMTSENTLSPLQDDLGQLLVDGDFSFLDYWTDAAQQSNN